MNTVITRSLLSLLAGAALAHTAFADAEIPTDHYLRSKWNTVSMGVYTTEYEPRLKIKSGDTIKIDTASSSTGVGVGGDPLKFYKDNNIPLDLPVVQDSMEIREKTKPHPAGLRGALLTGPLYIEGAEPGDSLEVRVLDVRFRAAYGINSTAPGNGHPLADLVPRPWRQKFDLDLARSVAIFKKDQIELPLAPFFGQMGVAPPANAGGFAASPPTPLHGGNFDLQELTRGSTLFLPVNVEGAYFYIGNGHALQGNGEITNPSLEVSLTGYFKFIVHKKKPLAVPHMETPTHYVFVGIHDSLDEAVRLATKQCVDFLQEKEKLDYYDAYALTSVTTDFTVTRALLPAQMVHALVPKNIFKAKSAYWYAGPVPVRY
ncbi:MAG TPA: acetamidase/formamidase family protein [Opitutaceae bacterium]|nr:acetamidase/formamidase family protein [Opitutaceae bacterium]